MRRAFVFAILLATPAIGAAPDPNAPALVQRTTVKGDVPDLQGRWLAVGIIELPGGGKRVTTGLWEVQRRAGQVEVGMHFATLPAAQESTIAAANAKGAAWTPSADDLEEIGRRWETLEPMDPRLSQIETTVTGRDAFDDTLGSDPQTKDARWVFVQTRLPGPGAGPMIKEVDLFAALDGGDGKYTGNYATVVIAAVPLPIPISLKGTFELHRVAAAPRGVLERLVDFFRGCGRR